MKKIDPMNDEEIETECWSSSGKSKSTPLAISNEPQNASTSNTNAEDTKTKSKTHVIKNTSFKLSSAETNGKHCDRTKGNVSDSVNDADLKKHENGCENKQLGENIELNLQNDMENLHLRTKGNKMGPSTNSKKDINVETNDISNVINYDCQTTICTNTNMPKAPDDITNTNTHTSKPQCSNNSKPLDCTKTVTIPMEEQKQETSIFTNLENSHKQHSSLDNGLAESCLKPAKGSCPQSKLQSIDARPIYPNVPYSPYASPYGSPHARRRPPLRESRRISIESRGSFLQLNQYKLMDQIGQGSYGLVKLAYSEEDSTHYAMKILSKRRLLRQAALMRRGPKKQTTTSPLDRVYREIAVLKKLDHPNVVKLVEVLDDPVDDSLYLVFELVKHGEVLSIPADKPLSEERAWSVLRDTLLGLEYLHYQRIIHADIKPGNLLLTECGHVKIADLGVCNEFLGEDATISNGSTASTPAFRAPETLLLGNHSYCGKAADIWALGATLYALVFGNVPFVANTIPVLYERIKNDDLIFPDNIKISDELKDCIQRMLTKDPIQRITLPQLKDHQWVTMNGTHPLPTEEENCCLVQISDEDINSVVRSIPKLDTLILIKTMLKKHSFGNPFNKGGVSGRAPQRGGSRLERFVRAGRSNSAPGAYNAAMDRQFSSDNMLPSLSESVNTSTNADEP